MSRLRYLEELAADTIIGLSLSQVERNAAVCARFLTKFSMSMGARNENVSASFPAHIGHQWARRKDDEIIHRYTDTVVGSAKENAGDGRRKALSRQAVATSGGHGARTRNPLRGTTFPVSALRRKSRRKTQFRNHALRKCSATERFGGSLRSLAQAAQGRAGWHRRDGQGEREGISRTIGIAVEFACL